MMFTCPSCGRKTKILIDGICPTCYAKRVLPEGKIWELNINLKQCVICGRFFYKNKSYEPTIDNLKRIILDALNKEEYEILDLQIEDVKFENNSYILYVTLLIKIKNVYGRLKRIIVIPIKKIVCKECSRIKSKYYEVIIQIRGNNIEYYSNEVKKILEKEDIIITKEDEKKEGIDLYVTNSRRVIRVVNKIKRIYNVEIKITRKLHTRDRQTSKNVYKLTVLLRFLK